MTVQLGIDFSSAGLEAASSATSEIQLVSESRIPAVAYLQGGKHLKFGKEAEGFFKKGRASEVSDKFYEQLDGASQEIGQPTTLLAKEFLRSSASNLKAQAGGGASSYVGVLPHCWVADPGSLSIFRSELSTNIGLDQRALVHPGLAACLNAVDMPLPSETPFFVLDIGRHGFYVTSVVQTQGALRVLKVESISGCGEADLKEKVFDCLVEALKTATGKIPVQGREDSQVIYDQLDGVLQELAVSGSARVSIEDLEAVVNSEQIERRLSSFRELIVQKAKALTQTMDGKAKPYFRLCNRTALIPGLEGAISSLSNAVVETLPKGQLAVAACLLADGRPFENGPNGYVDSLPVEWLIGYEKTKPFAFAMGENSNAARPRTKSAEGRSSHAALYRTGQDGFIKEGDSPTHLLFQGRLLGLAGEAFYVGARLDGERNGIEIVEALEGLLDCHFMLEPNEDQWLMVPKGEVLINREPIDTPKMLGAGDIIELPKPGLLMMATKLVKSVQV